MTSKIIGVGNYIPSQAITNLFFDKHHFLDQAGDALKQDNATIASKLKKLPVLRKDVMRILIRSLLI